MPGDGVSKKPHQKCSARLAKQNGGGQQRGSENIRAPAKYGVETRKAHAFQAEQQALTGT